MDDKEYLASNIWEDPDWEYVSASDPILVKKGYTPPIHDLSITNGDGVAFTDELLSNPFYNLVVVMYELRSTAAKAQPELNAIVYKAQEYNIRSIGLTAASEQTTRALIDKKGALKEFIYCDDNTFKCRVRYNTGNLLLKEGK